MRNLNHSLSDDLISNNCFITLAIACYTPSTRELTYANAGHVYPIQWSSQVPLSAEPNYLKIRSIPLGILPNWQAQFGRLILAPGDTLLLNSDGLTEAKMSGKMLGSDGLWQLIQEQPQPLILQDLLNLIQFVNKVQEDDQTVLSLEIL
jgi:serine phosphatase RsbU (regulator of sigma subunit)